MKSKLLKIGGPVFIALIVVVAILARSENIAPISMAYNAIAQPMFSDAAVSGYDPVAYFTENKPVKGDAAFQYRWQNAVWFFSSKENLDLFQNNPEKYAPAYGGYCAFAVSQGIVAGADPEVWKIVDGRLFLNNNPDSAKDWSKNVTESIQIGDTNWQTASR